jgi:hypothetical protein
MHGVTEIQNYLEMLQTVQATHKRPDGWHYHGPADLVLQHGKLYERKPYPKTWQKGQPKECYQNAFLLAIEKSLIYCEGWATTGIIPVIHAWCLDVDGKIVDPTWDGQTYFGIPFKMEWLLVFLQKQKYYGLLDNWQNGFPLMNVPVEDFLYKEEAT